MITFKTKKNQSSLRIKHSNETKKKLFVTVQQKCCQFLFLISWQRFQSQFFVTLADTFEMKSIKILVALFTHQLKTFFLVLVYLSLAHFWALVWMSVSPYKVLRIQAETCSHSRNRTQWKTNNSNRADKIVETYELKLFFQSYKTFFPFFYLSSTHFWVTVWMFFQIEAVTAVSVAITHNERIK